MQRNELAPQFLFSKSFVDVVLSDVAVYLVEHDMKQKPLRSGGT